MVQLCTLIKKEGLTPEFEEGVSYILQNYTLSQHIWTNVFIRRAWNAEI